MIPLYIFLPGCKCIFLFNLGRWETQHGNGSSEWEHLHVQTVERNTDFNSVFLSLNVFVTNCFLHQTRRLPYTFCLQELWPRCKCYFFMAVMPRWNLVPTNLRTGHLFKTENLCISYILSPLFLIFQHAVGRGTFAARLVEEIRDVRGVNVVASDVQLERRHWGSLRHPPYSAGCGREKSTAQDVRLAQNGTCTQFHFYFIHCGQKRLSKPVEVSFTIDSFSTELELKLKRWWPFQSPHLRI